MAGARQTGRRVRWVSLLAAPLLACGGRAEGLSPGEEAEAASEPREPVAVVPERGGPARLGGTSGRTTPSVTPTISSAVQTICYAREELGPDLEELLAILPPDALDEAGCLAAQYSSVLLRGGCVYAPSGADFSSGRCCYRMDTATDNCDGPR